MCHHVLTYPLEIDWQSSLKLICTHFQDLLSLLEVDIRVMVLVKNRKTVISERESV